MIEVNKRLLMISKVEDEHGNGLDDDILAIIEDMRLRLLDVRDNLLSEHNLSEVIEDADTIIFMLEDALGPGNTKLMEES